ncbi:MAG: DUF2271 domain-containing protein [Oscillospiraceae bacterium]|nr:DUF2271 domain-containing protein [Oscillospiraceae bacterium]
MKKGLYENMKKLKFLLTALLTLAFLNACADNQSELTNFQPTPPTSETETGDAVEQRQLASLSITFDFERQSGWASNQFAVWLEDMDGNFIRTLYATRWTADGGYSSRDMSLSVWVERSGLSLMSSAGVDAITGATPRTGPVSTGFMIESDEELPPGEYRFFVEGSLRWSNHVLFSGIIDTSGDFTVSVSGEAEYFFTACDNHNALTEDSPENSMLRNVVASFTPETIAG